MRKFIQLVGLFEFTLRQEGEADSRKYSTFDGIGFLENGIIDTPGGIH
jgi:hypothetical protein